LTRAAGELLVLAHERSVALDVLDCVQAALDSGAVEKLMPLGLSHGTKGVEDLADRLLAAEEKLPRE
jgi:hypothetical protein